MKQCNNEFYTALIVFFTNYGIISYNNFYKVKEILMKNAEFDPLQAPAMLDREYVTNLYQAMLGLDTVINEYVEKLSTPEINQWIEEGKLTLGLIRPQVGTEPGFQGNIQGFKDREVVDYVVKKFIKPNRMEVFTSFSVVFDEKCISEFYPENIRNRLKNLEAHYPEGAQRKGYLNRWEQFTDLMTSGPTTAMLIFSQDGQAVEHWRRLLGNWNVEENRTPNSIRGSLAMDNNNSIAHGSDSPESVARELGVLKSALKRFIKEQ